MAPDHIVLIVNDDRRIRESLTALLSSYDMHAVAFGSLPLRGRFPPTGRPTNVNSSHMAT